MTKPLPTVATGQPQPTSFTNRLLEKLVRVFEDGVVEARNHLRFSIVGGAHFPPALKKRALDVFGDVVYEYYGSMETGYNTIADPDTLRSYPRSSGTPVLESKVAVVDDNHAALGYNEVGRLAISCYQNLDCYVGRPAETCVLNGEEYVLMPDYGYLDRDGRLYVSFRAFGDTRPDSSDTYAIEDELRSHEAIEDAFVVPQTDRDPVGRIVCAVVTASSKHSVQDVVRRVEDALSVSFGEIDVVLVPAIPYSPAGKVDKPALERHMADSRGTPSHHRKHNS